MASSFTWGELPVILTAAISFATLSACSVINISLQACRSLLFWFDEPPNVMQVQPCFAHAIGNFTLQRCALRCRCGGQGHIDDGVTLFCLLDCTIAVGDLVVSCKCPNDLSPFGTIGSLIGTSMIEVCFTCRELANDIGVTRCLVAL